MKTTWHNFEIESELVGKEDSNWDNNSKDRHHLITVRDTNHGSDKSISFSFWTSKANPKITKREELLDALECFSQMQSLGNLMIFMISVRRWDTMFPEELMRAGKLVDLQTQKL